MKIIAFLCTLLIFSFSSSSEVGTNLAGSDVKGCAYSNRNGTLAIYDAADSLKILDAKDLKLINKFDFKTDGITSLDFEGANLYAGFSGGKIAKFSEDFSSFAGMLNLSNLSFESQITHLRVENGKIYAVAGKNAFISYDIASKKQARTNLDGAYRIATCQILNGVALITGWDRSVFTVNLSTMQAINLGKLKSVALSAAEINSGVIFGLASGEIASLKFDAGENLTNEIKVNLASERASAANSANDQANLNYAKASAVGKMDTNLSAEVNLLQISDKDGAREANLTAVKNAQNKTDLNLANGKANANLMNSTNLETKNSASTETKAAPNPIVQIYKISNSRVKSLLIVQDKVYIGLGNGEILRSDAEFKQIEKMGKNSDAVIKIFNDEDSVIAVSINGEIQIYKKKS
ncbi:hypothetical protein CAMRE0001_1559 [Campylobacter rectus RM3267]|uniref:Uncharacterized protein n=2 Tax=Campylobacter rectus TaxID=203 RepID=A0A6G5QPG7_CAMRE|nr:hypothetical protein [Campylobacter rectus]EEF14910.1 hypothetical protein CAMRE0001_1559 [Campylobacter rectus RM3267]QCD47484.1 hypothetical protein CRECT_1864 [Campylobacter rectus]UEB48180.1 PQQ-like beta-propeller repeat protein [Campylobacter rectus]